MDAYTHFKQQLLDVNGQLIDLLGRRLYQLPEGSGGLAHWKSTCEGIHRQLSEEILRVAVVGSIKSGKSTFANAILGGDHLKRGAGVVTSIVTRVRAGDTLKASLLFKSWDAVNADIQQALVLLPNFDTGDETGFDLRRRQDRQALQSAFAALGTEQLISDGTRNANAVLLASYLKGYDTVKEIVGPESQHRVFERGDFSEHRRFVGNDHLAVYLQDVLLEIHSESLNGALEMADCQGSDSPNPLHLTMIQDYLLMTHLMIYVISSRTGLREADIRFLSMIKKMGIVENILFVVNCDFSEHDSLDDFQSLLDRACSELGLIRPGSEVYGISALYNLFVQSGDDLSEKDRARLEQWRMAPALTDFSDRETARFQLDLKRKLTTERIPLLLANHLQRMEIIAAGLQHRCRLEKQVLERDAAGAGEIVAKIDRHRDKIALLRKQIRKTLDGAAQQLKADLRKEIDRFFDDRSGPAMRQLFEHIHGYQIPSHGYRETLSQSGFAGALYVAFQDFRRHVDAFMAEVFQPELVRALGASEQRLRENLLTVALPFDALVREAVVDYFRFLEVAGIDGGHIPEGEIVLPDLEDLKRLTGLTLPAAALILQYPAKIKAEAVMRLGAYRLLRWGRKLFRRDRGDSVADQTAALRDGVLRIKRETDRTVRFHLKDFRENLKFQYLFKVVDLAANQVNATVTDRFEAYLSDLSDLVQRVDRQGTNRTQELATLAETTAGVEAIASTVQRLKKDITDHPSTGKDSQ
jgi:hypothetical protein